MRASPEPPLIVTALLDGHSFARFDALRRRHFPPQRNVVPAHLTLFHALPGNEMRTVRGEIDALICRTRPFAMRVSGVNRFGNGVAYRIHAPRLSAIRGELRDAFAPWLTPQDAAGFRPHVTVQNKVDAKTAARTLAELEADFRPFDVTCEGLLLWRYLGGPWHRVAAFPFRG